MPPKRAPDSSPRGILVRVAIDKTAGGWNGPVDPDTNEFVYVPIPEGDLRPTMRTPYTQMKAALSRFPGATLPAALEDEQMHLDPDFGHLTYGDIGERRGKRIAQLRDGDFLVFYAGLRPTRPTADALVYALIGFFRVREVVGVLDIPRAQWPENAHTRRIEHRDGDIVVRGHRSASGRLRRCIPFGEYRDRAYRVRSDVLRAWGGLSCRDGYVQRSGVPPKFLDPQKFLRWFDGQRPELLRRNNP